VTHRDPSTSHFLDKMEPSTEKKTDMVTATHLGGSQIDPDLLAQGFALIHTEKSMPLRECMRQHWRALLWGMVLSLALVMDGYDGAVTLSFFGLPSFKKEFGSVHDGKLGIPANWQAALPLVGMPGSFFGLFITGYCQDKFGSRRTYMGGMVFVICVVFLFVFVQSLGMLLAAQALAAIGWAMFSGSRPTVTH
jgi:SP family general alpha glucoside:H+ symporter-like MFS transporter